MDNFRIFKTDYKSSFIDKIEVENAINIPTNFVNTGTSWIPYMVVNEKFTEKEVGELVLDSLRRYLEKNPNNKSIRSLYINFLEFFSEGGLKDE